MSDDRYVFASTGRKFDKKIALGIGKSLIFIKAQEFVIYRNRYNQNKYKYKCSFEYNNIKYNYMPLTDSDYFIDTNQQLIGDVALVVSLGESNFKADDKLYKFVTQVIKLL